MQTKEYFVTAPCWYVFSIMGNVAHISLLMFIALWVYSHWIAAVVPIHALVIYFVNFVSFESTFTFCLLSVPASSWSVLHVLPSLWRPPWQGWLRLLITIISILPTSLLKTAFHITWHYKTRCADWQTLLLKYHRANKMKRQVVKMCTKVDITISKSCQNHFY